MQSIKSLNRSVSPVWGSSYQSGKRRHSFYPKTDSVDKSLSQSNEKLNFYRTKLQSIKLENSMLTELMKRDQSLHSKRHSAYNSIGIFEGGVVQSFANRKDKDLLNYIDEECENPYDTVNDTGVAHVIH